MSKSERCDAIPERNQDYACYDQEDVTKSGGCEELPTSTVRVASAATITATVEMASRTMLRWH